MLVLSRKKDETICIGDHITVMVLRVREGKVRLGIEAPRGVSVHREEVYQAIQQGSPFNEAPAIEPGKKTAHYCREADDLLAKVLRAESFVGVGCREHLVMARDKLARAIKATRLRRSDA